MTMTQNEMTDIIEELIIVETEKNFITCNSTEKNVITFTTKDNEKFKIIVEKF